MGCSRVVPTAVDPAMIVDLDMDSAATTALEIRRGLQILGENNPSSHVVLDSETERLLAPFATMFQRERLQRPFHFGHVLLLLYAPIGVLLCLMRLVLLFTLALILPRFLSRAHLDAMGFDRLVGVITGTIVRMEGKQHWDRERPASIVVANHISEADFIGVRQILSGDVLGYAFYQDMLFCRLFGDKLGVLFVPYASRTQGGGDGRDQVRALIQAKVDKGDRPIIAFPEGGLTNGRKGLLQYHSFLFSLGQRIQPLAIQVTDGPFPVNINDETSTFGANVFWYFFAPWHVYHIEFLPVTQAAQDETALAFAHRVMKQTARALHQDATPFMYREKISFTRYMTQQRPK